LSGRAILLAERLNNLQAGEHNESERTDECRKGCDMISYPLPGTRGYQERIFPNPALLLPAIKLPTYEDVIAHFTASSLAEDGIQIVKDSLKVLKGAGRLGYTVSFEPHPQFTVQAQQFAAMHVTMLDANHAGLALAGADACRRTPAWNPMAGYPVNRNPLDGPSEWLSCLPLGMPIVNHRAVILMHYPPIIAYRTADYLNNNTLHRWTQVLRCAGISQPTFYHAIIDVNPIAAPGSGESEYPTNPDFVSAQGNLLKIVQAINSMHSFHVERVPMMRRSKSAVPRPLMV
jgi:hypothetical protein